MIPISVEPPYKFVYFKPYLREQQTNNVLISYAFIHKNSRSFYRMEIYIIRDTPDQKRGFSTNLLELSANHIKLQHILLNSVVYKRKNNLFHTYFIEYHRNRL